MDTFDAKLHRSIAELDPALWQSCFGDSDPFLRWDFLHGLERLATGAYHFRTKRRAGWYPPRVSENS